MRMVASRNLDLLGLAKTFFHLTDGRLYWSPATFGKVGWGRKELTPALLADFATVLDLPADDLGALTGIEPPDPPLSRNPAAPDAAKLIWDVRHLTAEQVRQVRYQAQSMKQQ